MRSRQLAAVPIGNSGFTMGITGLTTSPTGTASYQKVGSHILLDIPGLSGTSDSTSCTLTGMPEEIRPTGARTISGIEVTSAGVKVSGSATVETDGTITLYAGVTGTGFSAILGKGVTAQDMAYLK